MWQMIGTYLGDVLVLAGVLIMAIAIYGMSWLPNLFTRLHAASKAAVLGVIPILLVASITGGPAFGFRSLLILVFLLLTTPVGAHAMAHATFRKDRE
jgi:multicomponent Na+:H+ antiporter subunit G